MPEPSLAKANPEKPPERLAGAHGEAAPRWLLAVAALLGVVAFRSLLGLESGPSASRGLEDWFFAASDASPLVVLALSSWLLYRRWGRLVALPDRQPLGNRWESVWPAAALLVLGAGVLAWATLTGAADLTAFALLFEGAGLVTLWKGPRALRVVWLPGLLLLFSVPIPAALLNVVVYDFQLWTGQWTGWLLQAMGRPAFVSGDLIIRPSTDFAIIEGCSGMRSVETLTMLSILLVDLLRRKGLHALALVLVAPLIAFAMNGLRVLTLIFNPHSEIVAVHNLQGVAVLLCGLAGLLLVDALIERVVGWFSPQVMDDSSTADAAERVYRSVPAKSAAIGVAGLLACVAVTLFVPQFSPSTRFNVGLRSLISEGIGDWQGSQLRIDREFLGSVWFREELHARYHRGAEAVDLFLGVGNRGRRGTTFLSPKTGFPGAGWAVLDRGSLEGRVGGATGEWRLLRARARRVLVNHWYLGTKGLPDEALRSLLALDSSPFERASDGLVIRISAELRGPGLTGLESARERLQAFRDVLEASLEPLAGALSEEAISHSSLSGKSFSAVLDLSHLQTFAKTVTYDVSSGGTPLAMKTHRYAGVPEGPEQVFGIRDVGPRLVNGSGRSGRA